MTSPTPGTCATCPWWKLLEDEIPGRFPYFGPWRRWPALGRCTLAAGYYETDDTESCAEHPSRQPRGPQEPR